MKKSERKHMRGELIILATRSMQTYASRVAHQLETFPDFSLSGERSKFVGDMRTVKFADGEMEVEINTSIRGKDVFIFSNAARNEWGLTVEENKIELYNAIDALKRSQAGRITLFEPFCSSSRSDRPTRRNSVGFWIHYKILVSLGLEHLITYQLHSDKSKTIVDPTIAGIEDVPIISLLKQYIIDSFIKNRTVLDTEVADNWFFCSVDAGGEGIAKKFANSFGARLIIAHKQRDYSRTNRVQSINILSDAPIENKTVWIVDDMIDTGGSIYALVKELKKRNVAKVYIAAVHAVFSDPALTRLTDLYNSGFLESIVVSDTVPGVEKMRSEYPFLHVVSSARRSAELIMNMHNEQSLSPFFDPFDAREYMSTLKLFL
ncbi:MAG: ribose-phosphate diphosphokinase [Spirochaetia bacterium]